VDVCGGSGGRRCAPSSEDQEDRVAQLANGGQSTGWWEERESRDKDGVQFHGAGQGCARRFKMPQREDRLAGARLAECGITINININTAY
jgi:hypothetical protein